MIIDSKQIDPKKGKIRIGSIKGQPVYSMFTRGGLALILKSQNGISKLLAMAPHRGLAKYIAQQKEPDLCFDELSKSEDEYFSIDFYKHLVDKWTEVTAEVSLKLEGLDG